MTRRRTKLLTKFFNTVVAIALIALTPLIKEGITDFGVRYLSSKSQRTVASIYSPLQNSDLSTALAQSQNLSVNNSADVLGASSGVYSSDPRVLAMRNFLVDYNSPMAPYAESFIVEADKYGLDWRLVAAISGVESAFGLLIPYDESLGYSYNGWGWSNYTHPTISRFGFFADWNEGVAVVTKGLAVGYGTNLTPFQIVGAYCPPCADTPGLPWPNAVTGYMNQLDDYLEEVQ